MLDKIPTTPQYEPQRDAIPVNDNLHDLAVKAAHVALETLRMHSSTSSLSSSDASTSPLIPGDGSSNPTLVVVSTLTDEDVRYGDALSRGATGARAGRYRHLSTVPIEEFVGDELDLCDPEVKTVGCVASDAGCQPPCTIL